MTNSKHDKVGRRFVLGMGVALSSLAMLGVTAPAQAAYPEKPITVVIGWGAGGGMDSAARVAEKHIEKYLGQPLNIVYKPGGAGKVSHNLLVSQYEPDGYTIAIANIPNQVIQTKLSDEGFRLNDLQWVANQAFVPLTVMVKKDGPYKTLEDLVKAAKADPGKIRAGAPGATSGAAAFHYTWTKITGAPVTLLPYRGGSKTYKGFLGGEVQVISSNANWAVRYSDTIHTLAIAAEKRSPLIPDVPTFKELGYDYVGNLSRTYSASAKVPKDRIKVLSEAFAEMSKDPAYIEDMKKVGLDVDYLDSEATAKFVAKYEAENVDAFKIMKDKQKK